MEYFYAQLKDGIVCGVGQTSGPIDSPDSILIGSLDASILGYSYANGIFTAPAPVVEPKRITVRAFKARMTAAERIAIRTAAASSVAIYDYLDMLDSSKFVDLDSAETIGGLQALEVATLLSPGAAALILTAPIQEDEKP
jgi:hypothetical protein